MHASSTTVAPANRVRAGNGAAVIDKGDGRLRKATARTITDEGRRPDPAAVDAADAGPAAAAVDAEYFVHPFVD